MKRRTLETMLVMYCFMMLAVACNVENAAEATAEAGSDTTTTDTTITDTTEVHINADSSATDTIDG